MTINLISTALLFGCIGYLIRSVQLINKTVTLLIEELDREKRERLGRFPPEIPGYEKPVDFHYIKADEYAKTGGPLGNVNRPTVHPADWDHFERPSGTADTDHLRR